jgi:DNA-binding SARP family transcriptional activator
MSELRVELLGGFTLISRRGGETVRLRLPTRKAEALVAYLAVIGTSVRRDVLSELLWGDVPRRQARHSLRQTLSATRAVVRGRHQSVIVTDGDLIGIGSPVSVDHTMVPRLLARGTPRSLTIACFLASGDFLAGLDINESEFDRWVSLERTRARHFAIEAHERYTDLVMRTGEPTEAVQAALRLVALDPLHEWGHRALMQIYADQGYLAAALRQYEVCAAILASELGVRPSVETEQLRRRLLMARGQHSSPPQREIAADSSLRRPSGDE